MIVDATGKLACSLCKELLQYAYKELYNVDCPINPVVSLSNYLWASKDTECEKSRSLECSIQEKSDSISVAGAAQSSASINCGLSVEDITTTISCTTPTIIIIQ